MKPRELLLKTHRWFGWLLALFVVVNGVTGSAIVFYDDLDRFLNAGALSVQAQADPLPVEELARNVRDRYPQAQITGFFLGESADQAYSFMLKGSDPEAPSRTREVWVDPYTGTIRGDRAIGALRFDRRHLMPMLHTLHSSLLLGETGETALGLVATLWLATLLIGLALALPRSGSLWKALLIKPGANRFKFWLDSHRVIGLLAMPVLLCTLSCALYLTLPGAFRSVLGLVAKTSPAALATLPTHSVPVPRVSPEQAIAVVRRSIPSGVVRGMYFHHDKGVYQLRVRLAGDINSGDGTSRVFVDMQDGAVVMQRSYREGGTRGDRFLAWMFPLHSGQAFGWAGRLLVCLAGLVVPVLAISGLYLYLRKRLARAAPRRAAPGDGARAAASTGGSTSHNTPGG